MGISKYENAAAVDDALDKGVEAFGRTASGIPYDNSASGLEANNVQSAIDKTKENFDGEIRSVNDSVSECIKSPLSAEVGQVLSVKAVDEDGKPTEWECVDGGDIIEWLYLDCSEQGLRIENTNVNGTFPVISSATNTSAITNPGTASVCRLSGSYISGTKYKDITVSGTSSISASRLDDGQPIVFTFDSRIRWILGIPKTFIELYGISVVNKVTA